MNPCPQLFVDYLQFLDSVGGLAPLPDIPLKLVCELALDGDERFDFGLEVFDDFFVHCGCLQELGVGVVGEVGLGALEFDGVQALLEDFYLVHQSFGQFAVHLDILMWHASPLYPAIRTASGSPPATDPHGLPLLPQPGRHGIPRHINGPLHGLHFIHANEYISFHLAVFLGLHVHVGNAIPKICENLLALSELSGFVFGFGHALVVFHDVVFAGHEADGFGSWVGVAQNMGHILIVVN